MLRTIVPEFELPHINQNQLREFQKLYLKKYKVKLDDTTAYSYAQNLKWIVHFIAK